MRIKLHAWVASRSGGQAVGLVSLWGPAQNDAPRAHSIQKMCRVTVGSGNVLKALITPVRAVTSPIK